MNERKFPIVGIGASAGGLEAVSRLLSKLPNDTEMAFILVQHLDPSHESLSSDILSRVTEMNVSEVKDGMRVEPNCVYVIPPGCKMGILNGVLNLLPRTQSRGQHLVIDFFFESLAEDLKGLAIGAVLSGTGSDGTQGLMSIKSAGGITFAQNPKSAKFDSMPRSAIASGSVDLVLTPEEMAQELKRIAHHPYISPVTAVNSEVQDVKAEDDLAPIFLLIRSQCHVDFSLYKSNTVRRRIDRRMMVNKIDDLKNYAEFLSQNPKEVKALYSDILIHVTGFFRDPEAFESLKTGVFPRLMENRPPGLPIRIWVPGCSTGEEVYSIAISLLEFLGARVSHTPIQIFASDVGEQAIEKARSGEYPESISSSVSKERLSRFFIKMDGEGYRISKSIRDICIFSRHDITTDPPFAKIDLISCRNLLIYFSLKLQRHVIPIFHYALVRQGFLWLGKSETISGVPDLFSLLDKAHRIYVRRDAPISLNLNFPSSTYVYGKKEKPSEPKGFTKAGIDIQKIAEQAIQVEYPGVFVNEDMEILQVRGRTAPFVELKPGVPSYNLLKMAHPDLLRELRLTIQESRKTKAPVRKGPLSLGEGRSSKIFNLNVIPIQYPQNQKGFLYLILFEKAATSKSKKAKAPSQRKISKTRSKRDPNVLRLQEELKELLEYQQSLTEKFERAQEDLTAANEELQSANEELQSTNEELETAKEELQSGNEELTTVNDELQTRGLEQAQTNNDLINLLGSVEIPIVMLGDDQKVRRFTPLAGKALNLIASDIGRPLSDLKLNFTSPSGEIDLGKMVKDTIETMISQEIEVQDSKGYWFRLQVRPYKTIDNKIDGAVLALVDINGLKLSLDEVKAAKKEAERANRTKDLFLATLSHELRTPLTAILSWSQMIQSGKLDSEKSKKAIEVIVESAKAQAQLINDLLDVSRIVAGKLSLETRELDPTSVVVAAVEAVRPLAAAKSIRLETFFDARVGSVVADPNRLKQVFWNLLTNAVKFSAPESKVIIRVEPIKETDSEKAKAMIRVEDSGKGIDAEFLPHIFDRFSQEDSSSIRVHGGLGLGLAIVRDIVQLHGGTVSVESSGEMRGATFTVMLPIKSDRIVSGPQDEAFKNSINVGSEPVRLDGVRVLIVDDEANAREASSELLSSHGAEVKSAGSAKEGFHIFNQFKPHILVSDIAMPGEDGYSLIKKVRALSHMAGGNTPALAMTAYAGQEDIKNALSAGYQAHLAKPVDGDHFLNSIAKLVGKNIH